MLVPKLLTTLRGYTRPQLAADLTAGVIVGIVALPLAIAFAIASGLTPERGLYTAIIRRLVLDRRHALSFHRTPNAAAGAVIRA